MKQEKLKLEWFDIQLAYKKVCEEGNMMGNFKFPILKTIINFKFGSSMWTSNMLFFWNMGEKRSIHQCCSETMNHHGNWRNQREENAHFSSKTFIRDQLKDYYKYTFKKENFATKSDYRYIFADAQHPCVTIGSNIWSYLTVGGFTRLLHNSDLHDADFMSGELNEICFRQLLHAQQEGEISEWILAASCITMVTHQLFLGQNDKEHLVNLRFD